ncbi:MAG: hypothetical protein JRJ84_00565 [Deltaproteobacteria bacterium]|nr:hypothetical protein [Deltaproteobacteria bacterium]
MRRANLLLILVGVGVSCGCRVDEDSFAPRYASAWCNQLERCDRGDFESTYEDMVECREDVEAVVEDVQALFEILGCELDERAATDEIRDLRRASCEEFHERDWSADNDAVWDCR